MKAGKIKLLSTPDMLDIVYRRNWGEFSIEAEERHKKKLERIRAFKSGPHNIFLQTILDRRPYELERVLARI